jgi:putative ATP-binding cassette transporter
VIVISHDDHYYDVADRLIKLEDGKLEYDRDQLEVRKPLTLAQTAKMLS